MKKKTNYTTKDEYIKALENEHKSWRNVAVSFIILAIVLVVAHVCELPR